MVDEPEDRQETRVLRGVTRGDSSGGAHTTLDIETQEGSVQVEGVPINRCPQLGQSIALRVRQTRWGLSFVCFEQ